MNDIVINVCNLYRCCFSMYSCFGSLVTLIQHISYIMTGRLSIFMQDYPKINISRQYNVHQCDL